MKPTPAQVKVLALVAQGMEDTRIAENLGVSKWTARTHVHSAMRRLGAHTRAQAVAIGLREGWLT